MKPLVRGQGKRLSLLGGASAPSFYSVSPVGSRRAAGVSNPPFSAGPCYLITRTTAGEYRVPLEFIAMEEICR